MLAQLVLNEKGCTRFCRNTGLRFLVGFDMTLDARYAVVSYCPDLTSTEAESIPVAVLLLAYTGSPERFSVGCIVGTPVKTDDPVARAFIADVPNFIRRHLVTVEDHHPTMPVEELLYALHDSLRNSIHVSKISQPETVTSSAAKLPEIIAALLERAADVLNEERQSAGLPPDVVRASRRRWWRP